IKRLVYNANRFYVAVPVTGGGIVFSKAYFTKSAPSLRECPPETGVEVAFAGRSNAGKSSAINALTNSKLARTSKTPGRTQLINFFNLSETQRLVDLPGVLLVRASLLLVNAL